MKFPAPKTLLGVFSPIFLISWALGIGVIEYPIGRPRPIISALLSILNLIFYLSFLKIAYFSELETFDRSDPVARAGRINSYIYTTFIAVSMFIAKINAKVVNGVFPKLNGINDRLNILGTSTGYEYVFKFQIIQLGIVFSLFFVIMGLNFKYLAVGITNQFSRIAFLNSLHYMMLFTFIGDCGFVIIVRYLGNRFKCLNQVLAELNTIQRGEPRVTRRTKKQFPQYPSVISEIHRYYSIPTKVADQFWLLYIIRETRNLHRSLYKLAMELNGACGIQMLLSLAWTFEVLISILRIYYHIIMELFEHRMRPDHWLLILNSTVWNLFFAMKVFLIMDACETTSCEANRTGRLISKLRNNPATDEEFRDEINMFSLQLVQNPLEFSAHGFFTLNYSLIHGMIGAVTTYLIIIIQMEGLSESSDSASTTNSTI